MQCRPVVCPLPYPTGGHAFFDAGRDHFRDITPANRDPFAHQPQSVLFGSNLLGPCFELLAAGDKWREIKAERDLVLPAPPFPRVTLAVGTVAPHDEPPVHES